MWPFSTYFLHSQHYSRHGRDHSEQEKSWSQLLQSPLSGESDWHQERKVIADVSARKEHHGVPEGHRGFSEGVTWGPLLNGKETGTGHQGKSRGRGQEYLPRDSISWQYEYRVCYLLRWSDLMVLIRCWGYCLSPCFPERKPRYRNYIMYPGSHC